jgi:hypothetical protein
LRILTAPAAATQKSQMALQRFRGSNHINAIVQPGAQRKYDEDEMKISKPSLRATGSAQGAVGCAKQSKSRVRRAMDCFVARAPRNDGGRSPRIKLRDARKRAAPSS